MLIYCVDDVCFLRGVTDRDGVCLRGCTFDYFLGNVLWESHVCVVVVRRPMYICDSFPFVFFDVMYLREVIYVIIFMYYIYFTPPLLFSPSAIVSWFPQPR